jgi:hypothetical protein
MINRKRYFARLDIDTPDNALVDLNKPGTSQSSMSVYIPIYAQHILFI